MKIYIPSRSRYMRSLTLEQLGAPALRRWLVALVVPASEAQQYAKLAKQYRVEVLPCRAEGISLTRQAIGAHAAKLGIDSFLMLDDDLRFVHRVKADEVPLTPNTPEDNVRMLEDVEKALMEYAHASISARQANNNHLYEVQWRGKPVKICVRALRALGFQTRYFNTCVHGRVQIMEDFDVALQLMARGLPNIELRYWAQDQAQTQARGGCSAYRTHELHEANVRKMAKLWPSIVKVRDKQNKTGGEFGSRIEATIQWKQALGLYGKKLTA